MRSEIFFDGTRARPLAGRRRPAAGPANIGLTLLYQPRRSLDDGAPVGMEAQMRVPPPLRDLPPGAPALAEAFGQALETACLEAARWRDDLQGNLLCVTAPPGLIFGAGLAEIVLAALEATGLPPERLALGLGEAALARVDSDMIITLAGLRDLGVGVELAEFGAEEGKLMLLRRLPLSALRLSRELVRGMIRHGEDAVLGRAVIATAAAFGLTTVADGVKTEAKRALLACCGCDEGQGELFGLPVRAPGQNSQAARAPARI